MAAGGLEKFFDTFIFRGLEGFSKYYSIYRGFVVDIEDPLNLNRVKIIVPLVKGNKPLKSWAYPFNNYSGQGYGIQNLPRKGDMVWIQFETGDIKLPIWSYGHFSKEEKPDDFESRSVKGFITPQGHKILFNEDGNILIYHKDGKKIELTADEIKLNGATNGGLAIVNDVVDKLNNLENDINTLKTVFSTWVVAPTDGGAALKAAAATWYASMFTPTVEADISNNEVLH